MGKELLVAIIVGIIFGLVVTYGIYTANKAILSKNSGQNPLTTTIPTPTPSPIQPILLEIDSPESGTVSTEENIDIKGQTISNGIISIITEDNEILTTADSDGLFSQEILLVKGANNITITASDANQLSAPVILQIIYTTQLEDDDE